MNEALPLALPALAGLGMGSFFYGGLWLTVSRISSARRPGLLLAGEFRGAGGAGARRNGGGLAVKRRPHHALPARFLDHTAARVPAHAIAPAATPPRVNDAPSPDEVIYWQHNFLKLNSTIVTTWGLMLVMAVGARLIIRRLSSDINIPRWQNLLEIVISGIQDQSTDIGLRRPERFLGFIGTVFPSLSPLPTLHVFARL